jgi:hypothetical protein
LTPIALAAADPAAGAIRFRGTSDKSLSGCATRRRRLAALSSVAGQHQADSLLRLATRRLNAGRYEPDLSDTP